MADRDRPTPRSGFPASRWLPCFAIRSVCQATIMWSSGRCSSILRAERLLGDRGRQRQSQALLFGFLVDTPGNADVVRHHSGGVQQDTLVGALAAGLEPGDDLADVGMQPR